MLQYIHLSTCNTQCAPDFPAIFFWPLFSQYIKNKANFMRTKTKRHCICTPQFKNYVTTLFFNFLAKKTQFGRVYKPKQEFR